MAKVSLAQITYQGKPLAYWTSQLSAEDFEARRRAVYALSQIGQPAADNIEQIAALLQDRHMEVRWYAADALGEFGISAAPAIPALVAAMESSKNDNTVKARAAISLGKIGPPAKSAAETLRTATTDDDSIYRTAAAAALWRIQQDEPSLLLLGNMVRTGETDAALAAAATLSSLSPQAIELATNDLVAALDRDDIDVRRAAVHALVAAGPKSVPAISRALTDLSDPGKKDAAVALGLIANQVRSRVIQSPQASANEVSAAGRPFLAHSIPMLTRLLVSDDEAIADAAIHAMAKHGLIAVPQLLKALTSRHPRGVSAAALALGRMEKHLPTGELSPALQNVKARVAQLLLTTMEQSEPVVQLAAVRLFAAMRISDVEISAKGQLRDLLGSSDVEIRRYADRAIKNIEINATD